MFFMVVFSFIDHVDLSIQPFCMLKFKCRFYTSILNLKKARNVLFLLNVYISTYTYVHSATKKDPTRFSTKEIMCFMYYHLFAPKRRRSTHWSLLNSEQFAGLLTLNSYSLNILISVRSISAVPFTSSTSFLTPTAVVSLLRNTLSAFYCYCFPLSFNEQFYTFRTAHDTIRSEEKTNW